MTPLSSDDYLALLQGVLPKGPAWPLEDDAYLTQILRGWADGLARVDARMFALVNEADPRLTSEMLLDWERITGLPDGCVVSSGQSQTADQRRAALVARLTMEGGQSKEYFIRLAAAMGYTITITEFKRHTVRSGVRDPLCDAPWRFVWRVNASLNTVVRMTVRSGVNDPLAAWGNAMLECVLNRFKPAHQVVLFSYS